MKNTLLKIIIVIAFVGIFVVAGILFIKNRNIDCMAYNSITMEMKETDFEGLSEDAQVVRESYDGALDDYSQAIDAMVQNLNMAISFYMDYLVNIKTVSRGEQDMLIEKYFAYTDKIDETRTALDLYLENYEKANIEESIRKNITANNGNYVKTYTTAFGKGSEFFRSLVNIVNKYSYNGKPVYNYHELCLNIADVLGTNCIETINVNMDRRINTGVGIEDFKQTNACKNYITFIRKVGYDDVYGLNDGDSNIEFQKWMLYSGELDLVKLLSQKSEYVDSLDEATKVKAEFVLNFLKQKYAVLV